MHSICSLTLSQLSCQVSSKSAGIRMRKQFGQLFHFLIVRERGVLAEGAKFMMMSMDYNIPELFKSQVKEIRNFHFYRLINPNHPDLMTLGKRIHICSNTQDTCRYVRRKTVTGRREGQRKHRTSHHTI